MGIGTDFLFRVLWLDSFGNSERYFLSRSIKSTKCNYAILNPNSKNELLELNDIGILFNYLTENGFNLHNTFNDTNKHNPNFICYVSK